MRRSWISLAGIILLVLFVSAFLAVPRFFDHLADIHVRNVSNRVKQWGDEYRNGSPGEGVDRAESMLKHVDEYYPYEDMPEHRDREAVKELAKQRLRAMQAIKEWIDRQEQAGL
jgi:hypothetical protein